MWTSGTPVFIAANLFFPAALDVPFADFGVFAVVLDPAGAFAVEVSPAKIEGGVIGFLGDGDAGISFVVVNRDTVEIYIFCRQRGVIRVVRDHDLAVVAVNPRTNEFEACAVVDGEQIHITLCGAVKAVMLSGTHVDVYDSACGNLKAALVVQTLDVFVKLKALLCVCGQILTFFENDDVEVLAAVDALRLKNCFNLLLQFAKKISKTFFKNLKICKELAKITLI